MDHSELTPEPAEGNASLAAPATPRPVSVTVLVIGVLIISAINLIRLVLSISQWEFLNSRLDIPPIYVALTGFIWMAVGVIVAWSLWRGKGWAPRLMEAVALTYALYYWLDHIFLVGHPANSAPGAVKALLPVNWPFAAAVTVICLAYTSWTLERRKVKAYFNPLHSEPGQKTQAVSAKDVQ